MQRSLSPTQGSGTAHAPEVLRALGLVQVSGQVPAPAQNASVVAPAFVSSCALQPRVITHFLGSKPRRTYLIQIKAAIPLTK
jgi:hypothetical protein